MSSQSLLSKIIIFIGMLAISLTFIYPIFFVLVNALKTKVDFMRDPFSIPLIQNMTLDNFSLMISQFKILMLIKNSFIIMTAASIIVITVSIFAGYAFAKLDFRGKNLIYIVIVASLAIPAQVTIIPMYVTFAKLDLINNYWSVILAFLGLFLPQTVMLMTSYLRAIPNDLLEAAKMDGCNYFRTILYVVIPLGRAAIVINVIFNAIYMWNDLLTPMVFLQKTNMKTVVEALAALVQRFFSEPTFQMAGLLISAIPTILVYVFFQRYIVKGVTAGSIK